MTGRTVVVTGASGVVGAAVARELHGAGYRVRGWDIRAGVWTTVHGDIHDARLREQAMSGADAVVHAAALHAPHVGTVPEAAFRSVNVEATAALLGAAAASGVRRFVYTSSTSVYGHALVPEGRAVWVSEELAPRPRDIYDETKFAAEQLVLGHHGARMSTVVLRIARCFAEPVAVRAAHRLYRGVAVEDVARAHRLALETQDVSGVLNIAGPMVFAQDDIDLLLSDAPAALARRAPHLTALFRRHGWEIPATIDRVYDSTTAARQLGYHPVHDVASLAGE